MMITSKMKLGFNIIYILFIVDSISHIYEIMKYYNNMDLVIVIAKIAFRIALIVALLYLILMHKNK
jgi:hypothetical protein